MKTGLEVFIEDKKLISALNNKRVAYLGHPASVTKNLTHAVDRLADQLNLSCLFSPQHGWEGLEQANMIESSHTQWKELPVFSLYTHKSRHITSDKMNHFDILLIDLQDVGCRVYTFITTMIYALHSCAESNKTVWILDRPNPAGRIIEGSFVEDHFRSIVGAWKYPMRYGLTLGEIAKMYASIEKLEIDLRVIPMKDYDAFKGWPQDRTWIMPSPNMTDIECARCYSGTVLLEGTQISEGRGTTSPLKVFGFPHMDTEKILLQMKKYSPHIFDGCQVRACSFQPTFDKFKGQVCSALQIHVDDHWYDENKFSPYRMMCVFLKAVSALNPDWDWLLSPPYEYEYEKWPIDILSGSSFLRNWSQDPKSSYQELDQKLSKDEKIWKKQIQSFYLY